MCIVQTAWFLHQTNFIWYFKIVSIWLEDEFPFKKATWQARALSLKECTPPHNSMEPKTHQFDKDYDLSKHSFLTFCTQFSKCCTTFYSSKTHTHTNIPPKKTLCNQQLSCHNPRHTMKAHIKIKLSSEQSRDHDRFTEH